MALTKPGALNDLLTPEAIAKNTARQGFQKLPYFDQVVQEAADPGLIAQGKQRTCGATTVEYLLAKENPAEFVRLAAGLASPTGKVKMAGGKEADAIVTDSVKLDASGRSDVDRLLQSAFMDKGRLFSFWHYNNPTDSGSFLPAIDIPFSDLHSGWSDFTYDINGLFPTELPNILKQALGEKYDMKMISFTNDWLQQIKASLAQGKMVPVLTDYTSSTSIMSIPRQITNDLHYLAVVGIDEKNQTITLRNPWGAKEQAGPNDDPDFGPLPPRKLAPGADAGTVTMSLAEFKKIAETIFPYRPGS